LIAIAGGGVGVGARRVAAVFCGGVFLNFHRPSEVGSLGRTFFGGVWMGLCTG
jgi:hypothetical protein